MNGADNNEGRRNQVVGQQVVGRYLDKESQPVKQQDTMAELPTQRARYQSLLMDGAIPDRTIEQLFIVTEEMTSGKKPHLTDGRIEELMVKIEVATRSQDHAKLSRFRAELREILAVDNAGAILDDIKAKLTEIESCSPHKKRQEMI